MITSMNSTHVNVPFNLDYDVEYSFVDMTIISLCVSDKTVCPL